MSDEPRRMSVADVLAEWEHLFGHLDDPWRGAFLKSPTAQQIARDHEPMHVYWALEHVGPKLAAVLDLLQQPPPKPPRTIDRRGQPWSRQEDDYLREAWTDRIPMTDIAHSLARGVAGIELRLVHLRLAANKTDIYLRPENQGADSPASVPDAEREGWGGHWDDAPFEPADLWPDEGYGHSEEPDEYPPGGFTETLRGAAFDIRLYRHRDGKS